MHLVTRAPSPPLDQFVAKLWMLSDSPAHARERIVPSGTIELVIDLVNDHIHIFDPLRRFSPAVVSGAYSRSFVIDTLQHASIIGVHFRPGGAFPFLGVSAGELADRHVDLETLWGSSARELRERLCEAASSAARFALLENALVTRLFRPLENHPAVSCALRIFREHRGSVPVLRVAELVGLSHRRFVELFTSQVGMSPKLFCRVQRFQHTAAILKTVDMPNWTQLAASCGYYDQSHLIREVRAFSDLSPTEYLRSRSDQVKNDHLLISP
jgi:AraC-like DNA-binding protein